MTDLLQTQLNVSNYAQWLTENPFVRRRDPPPHFSGYPAMPDDAPDEPDADHTTRKRMSGVEPVEAYLGNRTVLTTRCQDGFLV